MHWRTASLSTMSSNPLTSTPALTLNRKLNQLTSQFLAMVLGVRRQLHHRCRLSSHRPATCTADVVNRALISRDDLKRSPGKFKQLNV